jgi:hypothetical protein
VLANGLDAAPDFHGRLLQIWKCQPSLGKYEA